MGERGSAVRRRRPSAPAANIDRQPQLQALRAIAVAAVIGYDFWPRVVPGGYVGIDVFFVVSGYLMTRSLLAIREETGSRLGALAREFYARRAARILPAALVTLLVCVLVVVTGLSVARWTEDLKGILASAFFVQNWFVAGEVYPGSPGTSPVQHLWALSVGEQFYLLWPVVVFFAAASGARRVARERTARLLLTFATVTALSLVWCLAQAGSTASYVSTAARFWELSLGGVLFVLDRDRHVSAARRALFGWVGLALLGLAVFSFDGSTAFPGWHAVVPALATALVILCSPLSATWGPAALLQRSALQRLGDVSYALYLVHWPLLVLVSHTVYDGDPLSNEARFAVLGLSAYLAVQLKRHVEDRFRSLATQPLLLGAKQRGTADRPWASHRRHAAERVGGAHRHRRSAGTGGSHRRDGGGRHGAGGRRPPTPREGVRVRPTAAFVVAVQLAVVFISLGGLWRHGGGVDQADATAAAFTSSPARQKACFAAISAGRPSAACPQPDGDVLAVVPSPVAAQQDHPYERCQQSADAPTLLRCELVRGTGSRVVVAGDAQVRQWLPAILPWATRHHFAVTTFLKSGCPLTATASSGEPCAEWNEQVRLEVQRLAPQYLITSAQPARTEAAVAQQVQDLAGRWQELSASGTKLIAVRAIPQPSAAGIPDLPLCVVEAQRFEACEFGVSRGLATDLVAPAAAQVPGAVLIDLASAFCPGLRCRPHVNGILVWVDGSHMSSYFARGLAAAVGASLDAKLGL